MKALITILIIVGVAFGGYKMWEYWDTMKEREAKGNASALLQISSAQMSGLS